MLSVMDPTPEQSTPAASPAVTTSSSTKPHRVLACVLCSQRKIKCDRKFPCANCVRSHAQCIPASTVPPRARRRRFPERELLDRLRRYERLLRQNNIQFEPLHNNSSTTEQLPLHEAAGSTFETRDDIESTVDQQSRDSDEDSHESSPDIIREAVIRKAWDEVYEKNVQCNDHLLFGLRKTGVNLSTLHPEQVHIFKLWQVYLDNVNPLFKVTHTPTLQGRIIDAASNVGTIQPTLEALMFGIYCMAIFSLSKDECHAQFGSPKDDLLTKYQFGCQQALSNCEFLRSADRECLVALFLYLFSIKSETDPQSLSSMLGLAIRIAQRLGLHSEAANAKRSPLEAEMRRRLWWALILVDTRICEIAPDNKSSMLGPIWDCKVSLNVNDFDLQSEMKDPPTVQGTSTEALFAVMRSEIGQSVRYSLFSLDLMTTALRGIVRGARRGYGSDTSELATLEKMVEDKYLKFCNPGNPLHFMTIWTARSSIAKVRLIDVYSKLTTSSTQQTDAERDTANSLALVMLECDTTLMTSPLTKGFQWHTESYWPFPSYIHLTQDLKRRPVGDHVDHLWEIMGDNYKARTMFKHGTASNPFFKIFAKMILQAWEARETSSKNSQESPTPPYIVANIKQKAAQSMNESQTAGDQPGELLGMGIDDFSMSPPMSLNNNGMLYSMEGQSYDMPGAVHGQVDMNQLYWNAMALNPMHDRRW